MTQFGDGKWTVTKTYRQLSQLLRGPSRDFSRWPHSDLRQIETAAFTLWQCDTLLLATAATRANGGLQAGLSSIFEGRCQALWVRVMAPGLNPTPARDLMANDPQRRALSQRYCRENLSYRYLALETEGLAGALTGRIRAGALSMPPPLILSGCMETGERNAVQV